MSTKRVNAFGSVESSDDENVEYEEDNFDYNQDPYDESPESIFPEKFKLFAVSNDKNVEISPERYIELGHIQIKIDKTLFTFIFSDDNGIIQYVNKNKIIIPPNFCVSPLDYLNENNDFLKYRGCYLIITKESKSVLVGFISYKILINTNTNFLKCYLRTSCVPVDYQGMRINSIITQILLTTILQHYQVNLFESHEVAIQKGEQTNGRLNEKFGFVNIDSRGWMMALRRDVEEKLQEKPPLEHQLEILNPKIVLHGGKKINRKNLLKKSIKKTNRRKTNRRKTNRRK